MGSQNSSSSSTPLTGAQRADTYQSGLENMFGLPADSREQFKKKNPGATDADYDAAIRTQIAASARANLPAEYAPAKYINPAAYTSPGSARVLSSGDYDRLQANILEGNTAGLDAAKETDLRNVNNDAAKRGIWSSGLVMQAENDVDKAYAPAYAKAGGDAVAQRYTLESGDNQSVNQFNLTDAAGKNQYNTSAATAENAFNADQAQKTYESKWRPADYLAGVWNGTGGTVSSGTSGGWSI